MDSTDVARTAHALHSDMDLVNFSLRYSYRWTWHGKACPCVHGSHDIAGVHCRPMTFYAIAITKTYRYRWVPPPRRANGHAWAVWIWLASWAGGCFGLTNSSSLWRDGRVKVRLGFLRTVSRRLSGQDGLCESFGRLERPPILRLIINCMRCQGSNGAFQAKTRRICQVHAVGD